MNIHYEEINSDIKLIHDLDTLNELKKFNHNMSNLFYSLVILDTKKPIFECCREFLQYTEQLKGVIDEQVTNTLNDMEYDYNKKY